jgi:hypothetical protein
VHLVVTLSLDLDLDLCAGYDSLAIPPLPLLTADSNSRVCAYPFTGVLSLAPIFLDQTPFHRIPDREHKVEVLTDACRRGK